MIDRRSFLERGSLALAAGISSLGTARADAASTKPATASTSSSWNAVRREFELDPKHIHLAQFFLTSHPRLVRDAIAHHRNELDRNPFLYVEENVGTFERAIRAAAARYIGADEDSIAMTDSTTMGIGLVYNGITMRPDQEILTTEHDHPSTVWSIRYREQRGDLRVRTIRLYDDMAHVTTDEIVANLSKAIQPRTRLLGLTWVHSGTGLKLPIAEIVAMVREVNRQRPEAERVLIALDGVHAFGVESEKAAQLGVDLFMAGCHKWIFGPRGTGLLWGSQAGWAAMRPTIRSFDVMWREGPTNMMPMASQVTPGGFHSFEHRWALGEAFGFHEQIGRERITVRIHELNRRCKDGLASLANVALVTPRSDALSAGLVCFNVQGQTPDKVVAALRSKNVIASASPYANAKCARFAPGLMNDEGEIDRAVQALRNIA